MYIVLHYFSNLSITSLFLPFPSGIYLFLSLFSLLSLENRNFKILPRAPFSHPNRLKSKKNHSPGDQLAS